MSHDTSVQNVKLPVTMTMWMQFNVMPRTKTKDDKLSFRRIKRQEIGRHPVGYVSCSVFNVSDVMRDIKS